MPFCFQCEDRRQYATLSEQDADTLRGKIPDWLLQIFIEEGFFSFQNGMFWFVNPLQMKPLSRSWKLNDRNLVFLRTAFGDFFLTEGGFASHVRANKGFITGYGSLDDFLNFGLRAEPHLSRLLTEATAKLGELKPEECYGFVDPISAKGKENIGNLARANLFDYVNKLAHLSRHTHEEAGLPAQHTGIASASSVVLSPLNGPFADFNFKLAIINVLHEKGYYVKEVQRIKQNAGFNDPNVPIQDVATYYRQLEIPQKYLNEITHLSLDGGDCVYQYITTEWDGEDDQFDIGSIEGAERLVNLKKFDPIAMVQQNSLDFSPFLKCANLEYVAMNNYASATPANDLVREKLKEKGVVIN